MITTIVQGLVLGSLYASISVGMSLVWGTLGLPNFAHGVFYMLGAYVAFVLLGSLHLNPLFSFLLTLPIIYLFGIAVERYLIKPLRHRQEITEDPLSHLPPMLLLIGFGVIAVNSVQVIMGPIFKRSEPLIPGVTTILWMNISNMRLLVLGITLVMFLGLFLLLKYTKIGRAIRASGQNKELANVLGIDTEKSFNVVWGVSCATAALAGIMISSIYIISPTMGDEPMLRAFTVCVFGGIGSLPGALLGGLMLGVGESLVSIYLSSEYSYAMGFAMMILILILRPRGLFGRK